MSGTLDDTCTGIQNFEGLDHLAGTSMNSEKLMIGLYNDKE